MVVFIKNCIFRQKPEAETIYADYGRSQQSEAKNNAEQPAQEKFFVSGVSSSTISSGILDVNNIIIHVTQNFLNFAAGTVFWVIVGYIYPPNTSSGRRSGQRSLESENSIFDGFSTSDFSWLLRKIADTSDIIASMHDEL